MLSILLQSGLFIWFILSLYLVATDASLEINLKILGEWLNLFSLFFIAANMVNENSGILYYGTGISLLAWYFYYTPQDISNPYYTDLEKVCYGTIDIAFIIYLISSMTLSISGAYLDKFSIFKQLEQVKHLNFGIF
jgi:hypothetical protein